MAGTRAPGQSMSAEYRRRMKAKAPEKYALQNEKSRLRIQQNVEKKRALWNTKTEAALKDREEHCRRRRLAAAKYRLKVAVKMEKASRTGKRISMEDLTPAQRVLKKYMSDDERRAYDRGVRRRRLESWSIQKRTAFKEKKSIYMREYRLTKRAAAAGLLRRNVPKAEPAPGSQSPRACQSTDDGQSMPARQRTPAGHSTPSYQSIYPQPNPLRESSRPKRSLSPQTPGCQPHHATQILCRPCSVVLHRLQLEPIPVPQPTFEPQKQSRSRQMTLSSSHRKTAAEPNDRLIQEIKADLEQEAFIRKATLDTNVRLGCKLPGVSRSAEFRRRRKELDPERAAEENEKARLRYQEKMEKKRALWETNTEAALKDKEEHRRKERLRAVKCRLRKKLLRTAIIDAASADPESPGCQSTSFPQRQPASGPRKPPPGRSKSAVNRWKLKQADPEKYSQDMKTTQLKSVESMKQRRALWETKSEAALKDKEEYYEKRRLTCKKSRLKKKVEKIRAFQVAVEHGSMEYLTPQLPLVNRSLFPTGPQPGSTSSGPCSSVDGEDSPPGTHSVSQPVPVALWMVSALQVPGQSDLSTLTSQEIVDHQYHRPKRKTKGVSKSHPKNSPDEEPTKTLKKTVLGPEVLTLISEDTQMMLRQSLMKRKNSLEKSRGSSETGSDVLVVKPTSGIHHSLEAVQSTKDHLELQDQVPSASQDEAFVEVKKEEEDSEVPQHTTSTKVLLETLHAEVKVEMKEEVSEETSLTNPSQDVPVFEVKKEEEDAASESSSRNALLEQDLVEVKKEGEEILQELFLTNASLLAEALYEVKKEVKTEAEEVPQKMSPANCKNTSLDETLVEVKTEEEEEVTLENSFSKL